MGGRADVGLWVAVCFLANISLDLDWPASKTTFARLTQSKAISQSLRVFITFRSMRDTTFFQISKLFFLYNITVSFTMVSNDLICTTPRLCQNNMTPVALRGRGTTSTHNCFQATGLYFKSKVLAGVGRGSTETTRLQHERSMFGDTHAKGGGGGGDLATSMATWLSSSLRNENGKLKIFVVRTTLLAKSHTVNYRYNVTDGTLKIIIITLTLSRASMAKSTVYGRWGLRHLNFVFICRMATRLRMKLRIELFFTVIKSFWGVHVHVHVHVHVQVVAEIIAPR